LNVFDAGTYVAVVEQALCDSSGKRQRGSVRDLANALGCHPTFIAHVLRGSAHFSPEQTIHFCRWRSFDEPETDFFVDLVARDRAGDETARRVFQRRLDERLKTRDDMRQRWRVHDRLDLEQQSFYYESWAPMAVHMYCQTLGRHTAASIRAALGLDAEKVRQVLETLVIMGLLAERDGVYSCEVETIHTGAESPFLTRSHVNWRLKAALDLSARATLPGMHYTSVMTMAPAAAPAVREALLTALDRVRGVVGPSPPEGAYALGIDFYRLLPP